MKYDVIGFDFDDTLIDSFDTSVKMNLITAKYLGIRVPDRSEFFDILGMPWNDLVQKVWPGQNFEEFYTAYRKFKHLDERQKIKGADEALNKLKDHYNLALLTSRSRQTFDKLWQKLQFPDVFKLMITTDESEYKKPDGRVFAPLKAKFGVNILYVGDSPVDAIAAKEAGIDFVGVLREGMTKEKFYEIGAKTVLNSVKELPEYLGVK